jgi:hypothetical protein
MLSNHSLVGLIHFSDFAHDENVMLIKVIPVTLVKLLYIYSLVNVRAKS